MTLTHILIFSLIASLTGWLVPRRWRTRALLVISVVAVYWLQPSTPIRNLDFWFPSLALGLSVIVWALTRPPAGESPAEQGMPGARQENLVAGLLVAGLILLVGLTRYLQPLCCLTPSRPPEMARILLALAIGAAAAVLAAARAQKTAWLLGAAIAAILGLFIILKSEPLTLAASGWMRQAAGQQAGLATILDLPWLGFSYLAFRLLHALRDRQSGRLPSYNLGEFVAYAIFFPAYTAGPIDRSQHFMEELRRERAERGQDLLWGGWRILLGVFKKFVLADSLAVFALNGQNAAQVQSSAWMWALLYAYTLRIYFDFSGYTDVAIGLARLVDIRLPENFDRPYLKTNLTAFWNSWHITLAQWFRAYFFNPLTRTLRLRSHKLPVWSIILIGQFGSLLLIGLWHGLTWNFAAWGAWHGLGLFVHNRWSGWLRPRLSEASLNPAWQRGLQAGGWLLTFHFVALGWVWFALPDMRLSLQVFARLIGM